MFLKQLHKSLLSFTVPQRCRSQQIRKKADKIADSDGEASPQMETETDKERSKSKYFITISL